MYKYEQIAKYEIGENEMSVEIFKSSNMYSVRATTIIYNLCLF